MLDKVIADHAAVSALVLHGWLHLLRIDSDCANTLKRHACYCG